MASQPSDVPAAPRRRHALGLPAGSIRALLALMVLGLLAAVVLRDHQKEVPQLFLHLQYLMFLILAHYFAAHGNTISSQPGDRGPLGLPHGSVRFLLLGGYIGLVAWAVLHATQVEDFKLPLELPVFQLGGFVLGLCVGHFIERPLRRRGGGLPGWYQDLQAWVALLAMLALIAEFVLVVFINPSLAEPIDLRGWEKFLGALVGFYFGARS